MRVSLSQLISGKAVDIIETYYVIVAVQHGCT
jgi:hypothetical protein